MLRVNQITPEAFYRNRKELEVFLNEKLTPLANEQTWLKDWKQITQRFRLLTIKNMSKDEIFSYRWNTDEIEKMIKDTFDEVEKHLEFPHDVTVTVLPAFYYPWFPEDKSIWTNGFTNGKNNVLLAVPSHPNEHFLKYMTAHELHHATHTNPIYKLTEENFPLVEWYKMEGGAEYFSLSLFEDYRWWKKDFTLDIERVYWSQIKDQIDTTDSRVKGLFCFGSPKDGIPYLAGYAFAYKLFVNFTKNYPELDYRDLLEIDSQRLIDAYESRIQF
ncbi:DUF2268 domain-containing putative Zn-dependent protease [Ornithinibacillus scapharcae]|uniref:DUF2268 domain-containing putative Zn-dependent protease n=1 Tax=Ornithinibacillus scapharcae TaxID=1147159 RepID=UPI000225B5E6|nr:DUF2268 domain-containing putative Zn-dependent protease [Ornithinibacillus scapharcae]